MDVVNNDSNEKLIQLLEEQLAHANQKNDELLKQIELLSQQVRYLTKRLYGSKSEKSKYQAPDGQYSLFDDDSFFNEPEHTGEKSTDTVTYTVVRKRHNKKKRNDSFMDGLEIEEIHHHPENLQCECCQSPMTEIGSTIVREEAKFIPATMKRVQHIEHAYECRSCKKDSNKDSQIKRGKAPQPAIQRSIAGPTVLAKLIYDKFILYIGR